MDAGWVSISECARLYGKHRKWVYDQIERHGITTKKSDTDNKVLLQLADMIAHRGEPPNSGAPAPVASDSPQEQIITPEATPPETPLLKQENAFLAQRIESLEADQAERQVREEQWAVERTQLHSIIERQTLALPQPEEMPASRRFGRWLASRFS